MDQRRHPLPGPLASGLVVGMMALFTAGCYSGLSEETSDTAATAATEGATEGTGGPASASASASATASASDSDTGETDTGETDTGDAAAPLPQTSRFPRLSHRQWENTVRDLFYLPEHTGKSAIFIGDPVSGGYDNNAEKLVVSNTLWPDYQRASEELAELVLGDPALFETLVPDVGGDSSARARHFIETFGARAYRRPLTADEVDRHLVVFQEGQGLGLDGADPFAEGIRVLLQTFLQSPYFLYRVELSDATLPDAPTRIPLSGWELASKLSYMLWDTMPDDALFAAAAEGKLDTAAGVQAEAQRMLGDPRAREMVASFHYQTLQVDRYASITKDPVKYPQFQAAMRQMMIDETMMFVDDIVFATQGSLADLFLSPYSFVNAALAPFYGVQGQFGDDLVATDLDPTQRAGIFTQLGFLAANASDVENDPIHRGVFLNLQILCTGLPPPPDNVPPPPPPMPGQTLRERIDAHTGVGTCGENCHGYLINPLGFAFEHYDPVGAWQTMDAGKAIDATGQFAFAGGVKQFDGAVQLAAVIAESQEAHRCYVAHLLEYGYARTPQTADNPRIAALAAASLESDLPITGILLELTQSDAFRFRAPVEE